MQLWAQWIDALSSLLDLLAYDAGLGIGFAIVALTLILRAALFPLSWACAWSTCVHQKRLRRLRPQLDDLRARFEGDPAKLGEAMLRLHRDRGVPMINGRPVLGAIIQMPVLLGMFRMLRTGVHAVRFLWVESLARPDFWLALVAAATTAMIMAANPEIPEQTRLLMIALPGIITFVFALKFASALAIYWATSNCFTAVQTWAVHRSVERRIRLGTLQL